MVFIISNLKNGKRRGLFLSVMKNLPIVLYYIGVNLPLIDR